MKKLNILELHRNITKRKIKRIECYENILELCHRKITFHSDNRKTRMFYEVPDFIIGYPVFDLNDCIKFLVDALRKNGFITIYYFPKFLYISWDLDEIEDSKQKDKQRRSYGGQCINALDFKTNSKGKLTMNLDI